MESSCWGKFCLFQCNEYLNTTSCWINLFKKLSRLVCYIQNFTWGIFGNLLILFYDPFSSFSPLSQILLWFPTGLWWFITVVPSRSRQIVYQDDEHVMKWIPRMLSYRKNVGYSCCHTVETTLFWRTLTYCT